MDEEDGVLSFEWTLLVTLLVIGIVSAAWPRARDAIIDELGDAAQAMLALDDSFVIDYPLSLVVDIDGAGPLPAAEAGAAAGSALHRRSSFHRLRPLAGHGPGPAGSSGLVTRSLQPPISAHT